MIMLGLRLSLELKVGLVVRVRVTLTNVRAAVASSENCALVDSE